MKPLYAFFINLNFIVELTFIAYLSQHLTLINLFYIKNSFNLTNSGLKWLQ